MEGTEAPAYLELMRQGARAFLEIPAEASADDVRRACLQRLEDDEFHPSEDVRTAIGLLVGETPPTVEELSHARRLSRCVERIVRDKLAPVALRLRSEPVAAVLPALEKLRSEADLFPGTKNWRERLVGMAGLKIPSGLRDKDRQRLIDALVESATTWPGSVAAVRRKLLTEVDAVQRFRTAARRVESRHAMMARFDPLLIEALKKESIRLVERGGAARAGHVVDWRTISVWGIPAQGWLVLVAVIVGLQFLIPFRSPRHSQPVKNESGTLASKNEPSRSFPSQSVIELSTSDSVLQRLFKSTPVVYIPEALSADDQLLAGEVVLLGHISDSPSVIVRNPRSGTFLSVQKHQLVSVPEASETLNRMTLEKPHNAAYWLAYGNLMSLSRQDVIAKECYAKVEDLGVKLAFQPLKSGRGLAFPKEPDSYTPPPPPLPTLVDEVRR